MDSSLLGTHSVDQCSDMIDVVIDVCIRNIYICMGSSHLKKSIKDSAAIVSPKDASFETRSW